MDFSIITVCKNAEQTISRTINSVLKQSTDNNISLEYIVIDGESSDNTLKIVSKYNEITCISEPDDGIYDAMNKGVMLAKGKYIGIINADDWYEDGILAEIKNIFEKNDNISVIHGDVNVYSNSKMIRKMKPSLGAWRKYLGMPINHPTMFVRKSIYKKIGLYDTRYKIVADYDYYLRLLNNRITMHYLDKVITNFSLGGMSTQSLAYKERVSVRTNNGMPLLLAMLAVILTQVVKLYRLNKAKIISI